MTALYWCLDFIDSKHAKKIGNENCLTVFFDHACSTVGCIFLVLTMCACFQIQNIATIWYMVQGTLFFSHIYYIVYINFISFYK